MLSNNIQTVNAALDLHLSEFSEHKMEFEDLQHTFNDMISSDVSVERLGQLEQKFLKIGDEFASLEDFLQLENRVHSEELIRNQTLSSLKIIESRLNDQAKNLRKLEHEIVYGRVQNRGCNDTHHFFN